MTEIPQKTNVFYQGEDITEMGICEADSDKTVATLKAHIMKEHDLPPDVLIFLEDGATPLREDSLIREHANAVGIKVHLHRCPQIKVQVTYNGTSEFSFSPAVCIGTARKRVVEKGNENSSGLSLTDLDADKCELRIPGGNDRNLPPEIHLGTLTKDQGCCLELNLVEGENKPQGFSSD